MTRTLALVGVALSAAGCMTVPGVGPGVPGARPSPHPSPGPTEPPGPADEEAPPRVVQAPAQEALSQPSDSGHALAGSVPQRESAAPNRTYGDPTGAGTGAGGDGEGPARAREPHARRPAPAREAPVRERGSGGAAERNPGTHRVPAPSPGRPARSGDGVCEMGEAYGRWDPDSEQARICRATYGG